MDSWREVVSDLVIATFPFVRLSHLLEHGYDGGESVSITRDDLLRLAAAVGPATKLLEELSSA